MVSGNGRSFRRAVEELFAALDQPGIPLGAVLVLHQQDATAMIEPGVEPGRVKEHQSHEGQRRRRAAMAMAAEKMAEPGGFFAEIATDRQVTLRRAVAFVEDQI